jgi:hypothetical protein
MTDQAMSRLRRRMIEDMTMRKFAPTQHDYVQRVRNFTAYLGRSPDTASSEDVRRYQLHLTASGVGVPTVNQTVSTLRFFFKVTLGRPDLVERTTFVREPRKQRLTRHLATAPAVSSLGGLRTPAPVCAAPPSWGRHPQTFTNSEVGALGRDGKRWIVGSIWVWPKRAPARSSFTDAPRMLRFRGFCKCLRSG